MTIAKHSGKLIESEVVRNLEKIAIKHGMVTPDPIEKTASVKESFASSDNLQGDMIRLVAGLRSRGYEAEANDLEDKIHIHKQAEVHLYRAFDEDGEDLIEFAHPEGDTEVAHSKGGYGKVETITSAQKRILEMLKKKPTGKYAAANNAIVKTAKSQEEAIEWISNNTYTKTDQILSELKSKIENEKDDDGVLWWWNMGGFGAAPVGSMVTTNFAKTLDKYLTGWAKGGYDPEYLIEAIRFQMLKHIYRTTWYNDGDLSVGKLFAGGASGTHYNFGSTKRLTGFEEGQKEKTEEKKPRVVGISEALMGRVKKWLGPTKPILNNIIQHDNARVDAVTWADLELRKTRAAETAIDTLFKDNELVGTAVAQQAIAGALLQYEEKINFVGSGLKSISDWAADWYDQHNYEVGQSGKLIKRKVKKAKNNRLAKNFTKVSAGPSDEFTETETSTEQDKPQQGGAYRARGGGANSVTKAIQLELQELSKLVKEKGGKAPITIQSANTLSLPKYGADGMFGDETVAALKVANAIRANHKALSNVPEITQANTQANVDALKLMNETIRSGKAGGGKGGPVVYDNIDGAELTSHDLMSPVKFYNWLVINGRLEPTHSEAGDQVVNVQMFEGQLSQIATRAKEKLTGEAPLSTDGKEVIPVDRKKMQEYLNAVNARVLKPWVSTLRQLAKKYNSQGKPPYIFLDDLTRISMSRGGPESGGGQRGGGYAGRGEGTQVEFISGSKANVGVNADGESLAPPISRFIDLADKRWWGDLDEDFMMDYNRWVNAPARSLASFHFGATSIEEAAPELVQIAIRNTGYRFGGMENGIPLVHVPLGYVNPKTGLPAEKAVPASQVAVVGEQLNAIQGQYAIAKFQDFLRDVGSNISRTFNRWNRSVRDPEARRTLVSQSQEDGTRWQDLLRRLSDEAARSMRRGSRRRR